MCLSIFRTLCGDSRLYIGITREFADTLGPVIHPRILVKISGGIIIYRDFKQTDRQTKSKVEARSVRPGIVMRYVCMPCPRCVLSCSGWVGGVSWQPFGDSKGCMFYIVFICTLGDLSWSDWLKEHQSHQTEEQVHQGDNSFYLHFELSVTRNCSENLDK